MSAGAQAPTPIVPRNTRRMKFLDIEPKEYARQLTLKNHRLFVRIAPGECFIRTWPKKFDTDAPSLMAIQKLFDSVSHPFDHYPLFDSLYRRALG